MDSAEKSFSLRNPGSHKDSNTESGEEQTRAKRQLHDASIYRPSTVPSIKNVQACSYVSIPYVLIRIRLSYDDVKQH